MRPYAEALRLWSDAHVLGSIKRDIVMAERVTVFFYGLFMDPEALEAKGLRPTDVRPAFVEHLALRLGARATLVPRREGRVYGIIMTLTHAEVDDLYSEPSVTTYRPEPVLARLADGTTEPALCFNLPGLPEATAGNPDYAARLQVVARKLGLPEDYEGDRHLSWLGRKRLTTPPHRQICCFRSTEWQLGFRAAEIRERSERCGDRGQVGAAAPEG